MKTILSRVALAALLVFSAPLAFAADGDIVNAHALALHGTPLYAANFTHFDYANPNAPKGGDIRLAAFGGFDNLNPFILKGEAADGLGMMYDTLLAASGDEAFTAYGLLAETIDTPADRAWVAFNLRKEAQFSDGKPVTAEDVAWSFNTLKTKGNPFYRSYYAAVKDVVVESPTRIKFVFSESGNRELPLIIGQLAVLPKHYWEGKDFAATTLKPPVGSGPYAIDKVDAGRSITYKLRADYWGKDLPVNRGRYNMGSIRYDYYRDLDVQFEAFKAGAYDFRLENSARNWATGYDVPAISEGRMKKEMIPNQDPQGMQGYVFNTRRAVFADKDVRHALSLLLDFEWLNSNMFYGQYTRTRSYFANSELASSGVPQGAELAYLDGMKAQLDPTVLTTGFDQPTSTGDGSQREALRQSLDLLKKAGYALKDGVMTHTGTGKPLAFEILLAQENFVRVTQPMVKTLARLGIKATIRVVDTAQYQNRLNKFDFDMIVHNFGQSLSPGNEQANYWSSQAADTEGSANMAGIKDPAVDRIVRDITTAADRESLVTRVHALDRVLLSGYYVIPQWHMSAYRVAYWNRFDHPAVSQKYGLGFPETWWIAPDKAANTPQTLQLPKSEPEAK